MADYQSLLTRAVANLPPSSPAAARRAIYERARKALVTQLRSLRPPLPESDIEREEAALDKAIEAVEEKFAPAAAGHATEAAPPAAEAASAGRVKPQVGARAGPSGLSAAEPPAAGSESRAPWRARLQIRLPRRLLRCMRLSPARARSSRRGLLLPRLRRLVLSKLGAPKLARSTLAPWGPLALPPQPRLYVNLLPYRGDPQAHRSPKRRSRPWSRFPRRTRPTWPPRP